MSAIGWLKYLGLLKYLGWESRLIWDVLRHSSNFKGKKTSQPCQAQAQAQTRTSILLRQKKMVLVTG